MKRSLMKGILSLAIMVLAAHIAAAGKVKSNQPNPPPPPLGEMYATIIVKACPKLSAYKPLESIYPDKQEAVSPKPQNDCKDVVIPPEDVGMNAASCKSLQGYLAALHFLELSEEWRNYTVGGWTCTITATPTGGASEG
jgi:hypothetical protein